MQLINLTLLGLGLSIVSITMLTPNFILLLLTTELLFLYSITNLLAGSTAFDDILGEKFSLIVLVAAASESTIFLIFTILFYQITKK